MGFSVEHARTAVMSECVMSCKGTAEVGKETAMPSSRLLLRAWPVYLKGDACARYGYR